MARLPLARGDESFFATAESFFVQSAPSPEGMNRLIKGCVTKPARLPLAGGDESTIREKNRQAEQSAPRKRG